MDHVPIESISENGPEYDAYLRQRDESGLTSAIEAELTRDVEALLPTRSFIYGRAAVPSGQLTEPSSQSLTEPIRPNTPVSTSNSITGPSAVSITEPSSESLPSTSKQESRRTSRSGGSGYSSATRSSEMKKKPRQQRRAHANERSAKPRVVPKPSSKGPAPVTYIVEMGNFLGATSNKSVSEGQIKAIEKIAEGVESPELPHILALFHRSDSIQQHAILFKKGLEMGLSKAKGEDVMISRDLIMKILSRLDEQKDVIKKLSDSITKIEANISRSVSENAIKLAEEKASHSKLQVEKAMSRASSYIPSKFDKLTEDKQKAFRKKTGAHFEDAKKAYNKGSSLKDVLEKFKAVKTVPKNL